MGGHRNQYGYHEYRGRGGGRVRSVLLFIIALLAVLLVAGGAFYMLADLEYTENGVIVHFPWSKESTPPPIPSDTLEIVTVPADIADVTVEPLESEEPSPTLPPEPEYQPISAVTVTAAQLRSGSAVQTVASAGGNALVVDMKDVNGKLAWQSQTPLATTIGANAADNLTAQAVQTLAQSTDLYLVARLQCFRDPLLSRNLVGSLMTRGGNVWHDSQGVGWSSPANQQAADYLSALCLELADMGFDEIVLDRAGYPNFGEVNVLATSDNRPEDRTVPVSAFLERLSGELAAHGVCLSVQTDERLQPGEAVYSGLTSDVLAAHVGRIWLDGSASAQQYNTLLTAAGWENPNPRVVSKNAPYGGGSWYK